MALASICRDSLKDSPRDSHSLASVGKQIISPSPNYKIVAEGLESG